MEREATGERGEKERLFRSLRSAGTSPSQERLLLGSTARLNLPQFTADFPRFRNAPKEPSERLRTKSPRTHERREGAGGSRARPSLRTSRSAYVRKPRGADLRVSELSPVLFNACLKLIKPDGTSLVPADPQSELRVSTADNRIIHPQRGLCPHACLPASPSPSPSSEGCCFKYGRRTDEEKAND